MKKNCFSASDIHSSDIQLFPSKISPIRMNLLSAVHSAYHPGGTFAFCSAITANRLRDVQKQGVLDLAFVTG